MALFFREELYIPSETIFQLCIGFDGVLAPSKFVAKMLADSGLSIPIFQLGHFRDFKIFENLSDLAPSDVFTFLHVSSCFPRKGVDLLLESYSRAFNSTDKVRLAIKGFPNPHNDVEEQITRLRERCPGTSEIIFINQDLDESAMLALYGSANAMVLPSRGEGFNLPAAEASAARVPLIVTGHGGHMDVCDNAMTRLVDYRFVKSTSHVASAHSVWVEPDVDDLIAALREAVGMRKCYTQSCDRWTADVQDQLAALEKFAMQTLMTLPVPISIAFISTWDVRCGIAEYTRHLIENFPAAERVRGITLFADERSSSTSEPFPVIPAWRQGDMTSLDALLLAISVNDPEVLVIQHQPGLMP